jgi:hypothetical protein
LYGQFVIFEPNDPYIWVRTNKFLISSVFVSGGIVLLLGVPAYFLLRWLKAVTWWSTTGTGFLLGAMPASIFTWPASSSNFSASVNGIPTVVNGVPTFEGWVQFLYGSFAIGLLGTAGAFGFWLIWRRIPNKALQPTGKAGG